MLQLSWFSMRPSSTKQCTMSKKLKSWKTVKKLWKTNTHTLIDFLTGQKKLDLFTSKLTKMTNLSYFSMRKSGAMQNLNMSEYQKKWHTVVCCFSFWNKNKISKYIKSAWNLLTWLSYYSLAWDGVVQGFTACSKAKKKKSEQLCKTFVLYLGPGSQY